MTKIYHSLLSLIFLTAASVVFADVGFLGPNGNVILISKSGEFYRAVICPDYTLLGRTPSSAKEACQVLNPENEYFLHESLYWPKINQTIRRADWYLTGFHRDVSSIFSPLTNGDVEILSDSSLVYERVLPMMQELEVINNFIKEYGKSEANLKRKAELEGVIGRYNRRLQLEDLISKTLRARLERIADGSRLYITKSSNEGGRLEFNVFRLMLSETGSSKISCGFSGSLSDRIKSCTSPYDVDYGLPLVTRANWYPEYGKPLEHAQLFLNSRTQALWYLPGRTLFFKSYHDIKETLSWYEDPCRYDFSVLRILNLSLEEYSVSPPTEQEARELYQAANDKFLADFPVMVIGSPNPVRDPYERYIYSFYSGDQSRPLPREHPYRYACVIKKKVI